MPVLNLSALPRVYNTIGLSPSLSMPTKGEASSTTTSAVAPGTIDIRENPTQDISALSRDTANSLNELGRIFDKQKIEEQQELAKAFGEEAFRLAHNLPDDGSGRKVAVHAIIGGIMSQITGTGFASGAIGAGINEAVIGEIKKIKDPDTAQIVSAIVGAAAAKATGWNAGAGATAASSGTKNNHAALIPLITLFGEATIIEEGAAIVIAGITYWAGDWLYEKYYYWKADQEYPPSDEHTTTEDGEGFKPTGEPNSSRDKVSDDGSLVTRRWYDGDGRAYKDVDFTNHGNPKQHPKVPHEHTWEWDEAGNPTRN